MKKVRAASLTLPESIPPQLATLVNSIPGGDEAVVDPFVPPMPTKVILEQATKFAEALARGEPNGKIAWTVLCDKVRELI